MRDRRNLANGEARPPIERRPQTWRQVGDSFEGRVLEAEQPLCIPAGDFQPVRFAHASLLEPVSGLDHILERVVYRVPNVVGAHFGHHVDQRWPMEVAAGGDVEVLTQIFAQGPFRFRDKRPFDRG